MDWPGSVWCIGHWLSSEKYQFNTVKGSIKPPVPQEARLTAPDWGRDCCTGCPAPACPECTALHGLTDGENCSKFVISCLAPTPCTAGLTQNYNIWKTNKTHTCEILKCRVLSIARMNHSRCRVVLYQSLFYCTCNIVLIAAIQLMIVNCKSDTTHYNSWIGFPVFSVKLTFILERKIRNRRRSPAFPSE